MIENRERNASVISDEPCVLIKFDHVVYEKYILGGAAEELLLRSNYVGNHALFRSWLLPYRDLIAENLKLRHYKFGEEIFRQGKKSESVYFVLEGQVELALNRSANLEEYILSKSKGSAEGNKPMWTKGTQHLDPFKQLSIMEKRKLRREEGYYASEQRYRKWGICVIGGQGIIGDVEATLDLPTYTTSASCIQDSKLYEIDKSNFIQLILKNAEIYGKIRESVHEKLKFRNSTCEGGLPIYNTLLTYFEKEKPADGRKQILKSYNAKRRSNKIVSNEFFSEMAEGRTNNRLHGKDRDEITLTESNHATSERGGYNTKI